MVQEKLNTIENQFKILECKKVVPFASFIYFSNQLNSFMNDEINKPHVFQKSLSKKIDSVILAPGEEQIISQLKQSENSLNFWKKKYEKNTKKQKIDYVGFFGTGNVFLRRFGATPPKNRPKK